MKQQKIVRLVESLLELEELLSIEEFSETDAKDFQDASRYFTLAFRDLVFDCLDDEFIKNLRIKNEKK